MMMRGGGRESIQKIKKINQEKNSPAAWAALSFVTKSDESNPALSAMMEGNCLRALAKDSIAIAAFPGVLETSLSTA